MAASCLFVCRHLTHASSSWSVSFRKILPMGFAGVYAGLFAQSWNPRMVSCASRRLPHDAGETKIFGAFDEWTMYDYIVFGFVTLLKFVGIGFLLDPMLRFYIYNRSAENMKVGDMRCRVNCGFLPFFLNVYVSCWVYNVCTFGMYSLFGFSSRAERRFYDKHLEWYVHEI
mmetsp:Transcript_57664/g.91670  ORF Transcript_57664/g.91670 Transcript_57664/m.91670 type:complete len:171 (-) Transcript_57664:247-759(-)